MPEGDTLRRIELLLAPLLDGQVLETVWFRKLLGYAPRPGQRIEQVRAVGKHLLIDFDRSLTLDTHLGMAGSWRTASGRGAEAERSETAGGTRCRTRHGAVFRRSNGAHLPP